MHLTNNLIVPDSISACADICDFFRRLSSAQNLQDQIGMSGDLAKYGVVDSYEHPCITCVFDRQLSCYVFVLNYYSWNNCCQTCTGLEVLITVVKFIFHLSLETKCATLLSNEIKFGA
jgi:hypothetical protein